MRGTLSGGDQVLGPHTTMCTCAQHLDPVEGILWLVTLSHRLGGEVCVLPLSLKRDLCRVDLFFNIPCCSFEPSFFGICC